MNSPASKQTLTKESKRVLVIEDMDIVRDAVCLMLTRAGYHVTVAEDGLKGMELFQVGEYDGVITDIVLPKKDGIEVILEMKKMFPKTKILAMSGLGKGGFYLEAAKALGADATLLKPFRESELLSSLQSIGI